jgi:2'-5' RNA ligase
VRLFVAVRPPDEVLDEITRLPRPARSGLRFTTRAQWHVTLRFLGEIDDPEDVVDALDALDALDAHGGHDPAGPGGLAACEAVVGPQVEALSRQVVALPVAGLDGLAAAVVAATATLGRPPDDRPFRSHLTLARASRGSARRLAADLVGRPLSARFGVSNVRVVRSHLDHEGARYEDIHVRHLGG